MKDGVIYRQPRELNSSVLGSFPFFPLKHSPVSLRASKDVQNVITKLYDKE